MKYTELFKRNKPDFENVSGKIQEAFMKAYLPNFHEFPSVDETANILEGDFFNIYKLKNTTFLENWKINLKNAEKHLNQILDTSVKIVREKWLFFLEALKQQETLNNLLKTVSYNNLVNNTEKDLIQIWRNNFWELISLPIQNLKNLFIYWKTGSWKTKTLEVILQSYANRKDNNIIILEELSFNNLGKYANCCNENSNLDEINDLKNVLNFLENQITTYKKYFKKSKVNSFEDYNKLNKNTPLKRIVIVFDWLKNFNFLNLNESNDVNETMNHNNLLLEKFKKLLNNSWVYWINFIISTSDATIVKNEITSNFENVLLFKTHSAPNWDIISSKLLWFEGANYLPSNQFAYLKYNNNCEMVKILNPWWDD